jgi:hypothetical protein
MAESSERLPGRQAHHGRQRHGRLAGRGVWPAKAAAIRSEQASRGKAPEDPLANFRDTAALFQKLQADPFGTVAEIVDDPRREGRALRPARRRLPS